MLSSVASVCQRHFSCYQDATLGKVRRPARTSHFPKDLGNSVAVPLHQKILSSKNTRVSFVTRRREGARLCAQKQRNTGRLVCLSSSSSLGVVITGGTKGFGYALSKELLKGGDRVMLCGRDSDRVADAVASLQESVPGCSVYGVRCDVACPGDVSELAAAASRDLGTVHLWINNAAHISEPKPLFEVQQEDLAAVVGTNVLGSILCCREAINLMRKQKGAEGSVPLYHIFNFGFSPWGAALSSAVCTHKATKTGLAQLNTSLADELNRAGIRSIGVHNLSPGMVLTDLLIKGSNPISRRIFNALAEEPETVAASLAPKVRSISGNNGSIEFLTLPDAIRRMVTGLPQIINGGRFFDKQGDRVRVEGDEYKENGVRLLYRNLVKEERQE
mmetsp:Transcript_13664/g.26228  ORF Transcript_13664/g.26228 Transcript_13664/m.26228 type:complete len:389 (+) Transcript_13664:85-1251(+)